MAHVARECTWTGIWGRVRRVAGTDGAWRRVEARVMQFLAVLGKVLLGIGCSVFLCLFFGS